ncbi:MAG TPA: electron transfer flavoprotein subunit beta/FixA family protein [Actinomycetota bacterium]|nr:electron transfer flavoprotein subunit beta/FixA family protein [Actinomycetota bacterium]
MNVVVLAKYIPNPQGTPDLGDDNLVKREGVEGGLDPGDEFAVEAALQLAEQSGGEVTVVSMGPEVALQAVQKALSMNCSKGVLISDPALRGSDVWVTARVLAAAIKRAGFDVVVTGVESTDGSTGTLPMTLAELLEVPALSFARHVEAKDGNIRIERQTETGYDVVECAPPALVSVTAGANNPRYPTLKNIMQAKQKPVDRPSLADLGLSGDEVRPTQQVAEIRPAPERQGGEIVEDEGEGVQRIVEFLKEAKVL